MSILDDRRHLPTVDSHMSDLVLALKPLIDFTPKCRKLLTASTLVCDMVFQSSLPYSIDGTTILVYGFTDVLGLCASDRMPTSANATNAFLPF